MTLIWCVGQRRLWAVDGIWGGLNMGKIWTYLDMNTSHHKKKKTTTTLRSFQRACISMRPAKPKKESGECLPEASQESHDIRLKVGPWSGTSHPIYAWVTASTAVHCAIWVTSWQGPVNKKEDRLNISQHICREDYVALIKRNYIHVHLLSWKGVLNILKRKKGSYRMSM